MNSIYSSSEVRDIVPSRAWKRIIFEYILRPVLRRAGARVVVPYEYDDQKRLNGTSWSPMAHTMIGRKRLDDLQLYVKKFRTTLSQVTSSKPSGAGPPSSCVEC